MIFRASFRIGMKNALGVRGHTPVPLSTASYPFRLQLKAKLRFPRLNRSSSGIHHCKKPLRVRKACVFNENGPLGEFGNVPRKVFVEEAIGAEYGEGFETFRPEGPLKVDVDFLNDRLQEGFLQRIRYAMKPDEAYGLVFSWENVVADTRSLKLCAWEQLALERGNAIPGNVNMQNYLLYADVGHVLHEVLPWGIREDDLSKVKCRLFQLYHEKLVNLSEPTEGLKDWLEAVSSSHIPCAVVSSFKRKQMVDTLERLGLKKFFQAIVSEEDGMESIAHRLLSAAVKLDRKPSKCVVFEDDPRGITAAHNCTMMVVALIGAHPAYHLRQADVTVSSFKELSVINLRRLFAGKGSTFMEIQKQVIDGTPSKRKVTTDTIF